MNKIKSIHGFRVGDVVKNKKSGKLYVVSGTQEWIHSSWKENGKVDSWISLTKEIGTTSLLTYASEYKLITPREKVGKEWWLIFPGGEK